MELDCAHWYSGLTSRHAYNPAEETQRRRRRISQLMIKGFIEIITRDALISDLEAINIPKSYLLTNYCHTSTN